MLLATYFTSIVAGIPERGAGPVPLPLIVAFCRRKSTRLTAVFGGLTAALGCLFTSFASQMHQVFLSYGFVMALGLSLARVTSSLMIGQYFKRRRERVEVIVASGTGCGVIIFSYSFAKIIRVLGWRLGLHAITGLAVIPFFRGHLLSFSLPLPPPEEGHPAPQEPEEEDQGQVRDI
ncbi:uncharacterized protein CEXT_552461 [Caerostris extrusa]|uniref:Monocarboxylate transporter n=1 Tax=Caerostris extrusa TaxID=172846 RepID=A0AAV4XUP7_CAEEX|nr:uncharacterized protein CEXT_552461 [Caerostris extrusa]